jgi:hypothetical protein
VGLGRVQPFIEAQFTYLQAKPSHCNKTLIDEFLKFGLQGLIFSQLVAVPDNVFLYVEAVCAACPRLQAANIHDLRHWHFGLKTNRNRVFFHK